MVIQFSLEITEQNRHYLGDENLPESDDDFYLELDIEWTLPFIPRVGDYVDFNEQFAKLEKENISSLWYDRYFVVTHVWFYNKEGEPQTVLINAEGGEK